MALANGLPCLVTALLWVTMRSMVCLRRSEWRPSLSLERPVHQAPAWGACRLCPPGGGLSHPGLRHSPRVLEPGSPPGGLDRAPAWGRPGLRPDGGQGVPPWRPPLVGRIRVAGWTPLHPPPGRDPRRPQTRPNPALFGPNFSGFLAPCGAAPRGGGGAPPTTLILLRNQRAGAVVRPPPRRAPGRGRSEHLTAKKIRKKSLFF